MGAGLDNPLGAPGEPSSADTFDTSSAPFGVAATTPSDGGLVTALPRSFSVQFTRPINPLSLSGQDLVLETTDSSGNLIQVFPSSEHLDATGTILFASVPVGTVFVPGVYHLRVSETAFLQSQAGDIYWPDDPFAPLATFALRPESAALAGATNLGSVGFGIQTVSGQLNLIDVPGQVRLYRFQIRAGVDGAASRLGAEVVPVQGGSSAGFELALFDARGNLIQMGQSGLTETSGSSFLFSALQPGTYYLGVSGVGDRPATRYGYDPVSGRSTLVLTEKPGGAFQLRLVADTVPAAARVTGIHTEFADRNDANSPTGFWIQFSDAAMIVPAPGAAFAASQVVELVDGQGKAWPAVVAGFDATHRSLHVIVSGRLPVGSYTARLVPQASIADLIGRPIATASADLGTFEVGQGRAPHTANDLGTLYPDDLTESRLRGLSLQAGESYSYRFVISLEPLGSLSVAKQGGSLDITLTSLASGSVVRFTLGAAESLLQAGVNLPPGEVLLTLSASSGGNGVLVSWRVGGSWEPSDVGLNGIGQASALGLRFVATIPDQTATGASSPGSFTPGPAASGGSAGPFLVPPVTSAPGITVSGAGSPFNRGAELREAQGPSFLASGAFLSTSSGQLLGRPADTSTPGASVSVPGVAMSSTSTSTLATASHPVGMGSQAVLSQISPFDMADVPYEATEHSRVIVAEGLVQVADEVGSRAMNESAEFLKIVDWIASFVEGRADHPMEEAPAPRESLAALDPFSTLARLVGGREGAELSEEPGLADPRTLFVGGALALVVAVEGPRRIARWRGQKAVMRKLRTGETPLPSPRPGGPHGRATGLFRPWLHRA